MKKLTLSDWGSIAEIIATIAVIVSLALVIGSIRQNTAVVRAASESSLYDLTDRWLADAFSNPTVIVNWNRLLEGETLEETEFLQVRVMISRSMNAWENAYSNYKAGLLSDELWELLHASNLDWAKSRSPPSLWKDLADSTRDRELIEMIEADYLAD